MTFAEIDSLVDETVKFVTGWATQKQNYEASSAAKDKQIADLTAQMQTATATSQADETEIGTLHDKLTALSALIAGQTASTTAPTVSDASSNAGAASSPNPQQTPAAAAA